MSKNKDLFSYFMVKGEVVGEILDTYLQLCDQGRLDVMKARMEVGADEISSSTSVFNGSQFENFCFKKGTEFPFKFKSSLVEACDNEDGVEYMSIKPYKTSKAGKEFSKKMSNLINDLNAKYQNTLNIESYLLTLFKCRDWDMQGTSLLVPWVGVDSDTKTIVLKVLNASVKKMPIEQYQIKQISETEFNQLIEELTKI